MAGLALLVRDEPEATTFLCFFGPVETLDMSALNINALFPMLTLLTPLFHSMRFILCRGNPLSYIAPYIDVHFRSKWAVCFDRLYARK